MITPQQHGDIEPTWWRDDRRSERPADDAHQAWTATAGHPFIVGGCVQATNRDLRLRQGRTGSAHTGTEKRSSEDIHHLV